MTSFAITSCGTDVGKTFIACALIEALRANGTEVQALKPVISGMDDTPLDATDSGRLLIAMGRDVTAQNVASISPWQFGAPLAPSIAARLEHRPINADDVVRWCHAQIMQQPDAITVIEGAGGVMAPLTDTHTQRDVLQMLGLPVILVTGCYLGSLSHTLTALEALRNAQVAAIIVTDKGAASVGLTATCDELKRFVPESIPLFPVPFTNASPDVSAIIRHLESLCS